MEVQLGHKFLSANTYIQQDIRNGYFMFNDIKVRNNGGGPKFMRE